MILKKFIQARGIAQVSLITEINNDMVLSRGGLGRVVLKGEVKKNL